MNDPHSSLASKSPPERAAVRPALDTWDTVAMKRPLLLSRPAGIAIAVGIVCLSIPAACIEQKKADAAKVAESAAAPAEAKQFCANNLAIAGEARIAWQTSKLVDLEEQIKQRLAELDARKVQLVEWLKKHDEAMKKATDEVIAIYSHMKPDAAALQLAVMDDAIAAAVIAKLPPRVAGTILNEMEPARAAQLAHGMLAPENAPQGKRS
jgi:flagellar motility protein MotE (MotC chaperone)